LQEIIINQILQSFSSPALDTFFQIITFFGHPLPWIILAAWLFWLGKEKKSFMLMSLILVSSLVAGALKILIARPRPEGLIFLESQTETFSMPSGHSVIAGTIYSFFEKRVFPKERYFLLLLVLLTGLSRLYLGVHFLSDVLAGLLIGYIIGKLLMRLEKKIDKAHLKISKFSEEKLLATIFVAMLLAIVLLPSTTYLAFVLFGYYFGFVIYRDSKYTIKSENKKLNLLFGTIILSVISYFAFFSTGLLSIALFLLAGLYITLIWPFVLNKTKL
jgi:membrane-associated phospholipid phosphatase